jgi:beta-galactosidase GanA
LGYNGVSFYSAWALHEPKHGSFQAEGIWDWEPYFDAAKEAGIYLVAVRKIIRAYRGWLRD